jgi:hypothetical protein
MIDLTTLTDEQLLELEDNIRDFIRSKKIVEPDFHLYNSVQIQHTETVSQDTLIPYFEFKITANKEDIHHYRMLWESYYKKQKEFYKYHLSLPPEKQVTIEIKNVLQEKFRMYLDELFPTVHYG